MKCKACGGPLVMRETHDYTLDENGVFATIDDYPGNVIESGVYCLDCGAGHSYEEIHVSGDHITVALDTNSDPEPIATVAIAIRGGIPEAIGADKLIRLLVLDEDRQEIGQFSARPDDSDEWWEQVQIRASLIPKGEFKASFAEEENGG